CSDEDIVEPKPTRIDTAFMLRENIDKKVMEQFESDNEDELDIQAVNLQREEIDSELVRSTINSKGNWQSSEMVGDSGATRHVVAQPYGLQDYISTPGVHIMVGDGRKVRVMGSGTLQLVVKYPYVEGEDLVITLKNVAYVPEMVVDLFSYARAVENGTTQVIMGNEQTIIRTKSPTYLPEELVEWCDTQLLNEELPTWDRALAITSARKDRGAVYGITALHKMLGHASVGVVRRVASSLGIRLEGDFVRCVSCSLSKMQRSPIPKTTGVRAMVKLERVYMDLSGPMPASFGGRRYILSITDDCTRMRWCQFITHKSETTQAVKEWLAQTATAMDLKVRRIRTDNGGEFTSTEFMTFCVDNGIWNEFTSRAAPEFNGVSERSIVIIRDKAKAMLEDLSESNIQRLWAEAMAYATLVTNLSSSTAVIGNLSPYEAFFDMAPPVTMLKPFGSLCVAHVPKSKRNKLDARGQVCILLGIARHHSFDCHKLLNLRTLRTIVTRDVVYPWFNHLEAGHASATTTAHSRKGVHFDEISEKPSQHLGDNSAAEHGDDQYWAEDYDPDAFSEDELSDEEEDDMETSSKLRKPDLFDQDDVDEQRVADQTPMLTAASDPAAGDSMNTDHAGDSNEWIDAINVEMQALNSHGVVEEVPIPKDARLIGTKFIFGIKTDSEGREVRKKARLVAQGYDQAPGTEFNMRYSPVASGVIVRMIIALAARNDLVLRQFDVSTAYLHATLSDKGEETIYLKPPIGLQQDGKCWKALKALYGLIQSPSKWQYHLASVMKRLGLVRCEAEPCLYICDNYQGHGRLSVVIYVDDGLVSCRENEAINIFMKELGKHLTIKDLGEAKHFLGLRITRDLKKGTIKIDQGHYVKDCLTKFKMEDCAAAETPAIPGQKLMSNTGEPMLYKGDISYRTVVGALLWLSSNSRPDLASSIRMVSQHVISPGKEHWKAITRILRYISGTATLGITYHRSNMDEPPALHAHADADFGGDVETRRSVSGGVIYLAGGAVAWMSKKQTLVTLSSTEAELVALTEVAKTVMWLRQVGRPLGLSTDAVWLGEDNQAALFLSGNPASTKRSRHVDIRYHWVREAVQNGHIQLYYLQTQRNTADAFTKQLPKDLLYTHRYSMMGMGVPPEK
ncbi:unnamed protein product, partial [Chrysoparadoxa australica]